MPIPRIPGFKIFWRKRYSKKKENPQVEKRPGDFCMTTYSLSLIHILIGVDIGTQSTRAAVMEESGRILTQASKETELIYEGDRWVWQEPDRMYGDAVETVKACLLYTSMRVIFSAVCRDFGSSQ